MSQRQQTHNPNKQRREPQHFKQAGKPVHAVPPSQAGSNPAGRLGLAQQLEALYDNEASNDGVGGSNGMNDVSSHALQPPPQVQ